ncbi:homoserine kinase [Rhodothermus profundi]|uniref:homoserine kinase n=1 Tax=Rhodothermus profundi TaxID=633813 RepID=UPI001FE9BDB0|nr:homoserine kinase [Rhodothermus profundi]
MRVWGPGSLSNLGPGFDALGLCIQHLGDRVEAWRIETPGVRLVETNGPPGSTIPSDPATNTAAVAAAAVLRQAGASYGLALRLHKGLPSGSGLGGSAASAVAGAWAANLLLDQPLPKEALVEAVLEGEAVASGSRHGDNVLPALFGGLVLVSASDPTCYRRIPLPAPPAIALILPRVEILTRSARDMLPRRVSLRDAVHNASALAFLIDAFRAGDWETVGRWMMADRLVEPVRAALVPCYEAVRQAALAIGAFGCALTGSGPAMFALARDATHAQQVLAAMCEACQESGVAVKGYVTAVDLEGVRQL